MLSSVLDSRNTKIKIMFLFPDLTDFFSSSPEEACSVGHMKSHVMEKQFVSSKALQDDQ